jgi:hypothetical protein
MKLMFLQPLRQRNSSMTFVLNDTLGLLSAGFLGGNDWEVLGKCYEFRSGFGHLYSFY